MGYWSYHPMGGDAPSDVKWVIDDHLFTEEEQGADLHYNQEEYKQRLQEKIAELVDLDYGRGWVDFDFVLPFTIAKYGIRIHDEVLSRIIKNMIGDGGAEERGYELPSKESTEYPTVQNGWNGLKAPYDYARKLYDQWDDLVKGNLPEESVPADRGLFAAINAAIEENNGEHPGLINKK